MQQKIRIVKHGVIVYKRALALQQELVRSVVDGGAEALLLCEHPKTLTLGRKYHADNIFVSREELALRGFDVEQADRGGDVTLHAPGQLVVYPVMDLRRRGRDLSAYLSKLEQTCVDFLRDFDIVAIESGADKQYRGVWVGPAKIASIGVAVSHWVTYHGMAINISTDLDLFKVIRPCGLNTGMISLQRLTKKCPSMSDAADKFAEHFIRIFS